MLSMKPVDWKRHKDLLCLTECIGPSKKGSANIYQNKRYKQLNVLNEVSINFTCPDLLIGKQWQLFGCVLLEFFMIQ